MTVGFDLEYVKKVAEREHQKWVTSVNSLGSRGRF